MHECCMEVEKLGRASKVSTKGLQIMCGDNFAEMVGFNNLETVLGNSEGRVEAEVNAVQSGDTNVKIHARGGFQPVMVHIKNPQLQKHVKCKIDLGDDVSVGPNLVIPRGPFWSQRLGTKVLIPVVTKTSVPQQLLATEVPARALYPSLMSVEWPTGQIVNTLRFEKSRPKLYRDCGKVLLVKSRYSHLASLGVTRLGALDWTQPSRRHPSCPSQQPLRTVEIHMNRNSLQRILRYPR